MPLGDYQLTNAFTYNQQIVTVPWTGANTNTITLHPYYGNPTLTPAPEMVAEATDDPIVWLRGRVREITDLVA